MRAGRGVERGLPVPYLNAEWYFILWELDQEAVRAGVRYAAVEGECGAVWNRHCDMEAIGRESRAA